MISNSQISQKSHSRKIPVGRSSRDDGNTEQLQKNHVETDSKHFDTNQKIRRRDPFIIRCVRKIARILVRLIHIAITKIPYFHFIKGTQGSQNPCLLRYWFWQKFLGLNRAAYWPVHFSSKVNQPQNVLVGVDSAPGYEPGCYIQGFGPVCIGDYTQFAANVGIISANHDLTDLRKHSEKPGVTIGSYCWFGMNSVILPGVVLGDFTIVGANSVVTKSFQDGHCVIAGSPAKVVQKICPTECKLHRLERPYHGYVRHEDFADYRERWLRI